MEVSQSSQTIGFSLPSGRLLGKKEREGTWGVPSLDLSNGGVGCVVGSVRNVCSNDHQFWLLTILTDLEFGAAHGELPAC